MKNKSVNPVPEGYHTLTTYLIVNEAGKLIDFIRADINASEVSLTKNKEGGVMHADLQIGDSHLMLAEASDKYPSMSSMIYMYTEDCDAVYKKAIAAGGISIREPTDEPYGDRSCGIRDFAGNQWWIATHIEDVSNEPMQ